MLELNITRTKYRQILVQHMITVTIKALFLYVICLKTQLNKRKNI
jgi:hypothetical protein